MILIDSAYSVNEYLVEKGYAASSRPGTEDSWNGYLVACLLLSFGLFAAAVMLAARETHARSRGSRKKHAPRRGSPSLSHRRVRANRFAAKRPTRSSPVARDAVCVVALDP